MQAYVIAAEPIHENSVNYFAATLGFYRLGYYVDRFRLGDLPQLDVTGETPVFGGMESISQIFPSYHGIPYFPRELAGFLGRDISTKPFREAKPGEFIKPLEGDHKQFPAMILDDSVVATIKLGAVPPDRPVYVANPVKFVSEHRCYVLDGEVQAIHSYKGDATVFPDSARILAMVGAFLSSPVAYGLDVGVLDSGETVLVEVNDYCCLGNYGIRPTPYAFAIARRWEQLWAEYRQE